MALGLARGRPIRGWHPRSLHRAAAAAVLLGTLYLFGCGAARGVTALPPGVSAQIFEQRYEVSGTTVEEIGRSLRETGSSVLGGNRVGLHNWNLSWNYTYGEGVMGCEIKDVVMELTSTVTVPVWTEREEADPEVAELWDEYLSALEAHEYRHRQLSYLATRELSLELSRLRVEACTLMTQRAGLMGEEILEKYRVLNEEVDQERLPWPPRPGAG